VRASVRHFAPGAGVLEDPATGSAAGALGACLQAGLGGGDDLELTISQGSNLARPAEIRVVVGPGPSVTVGGRVRPVFSATLDQDALP
ncbi:MAG: PhzF family phenazine biosynthesis protein, partial [Thermoleophilia bacterium]|nr:PhzF family phenazine biosynthesis protein [Thermoleophilia bacterium]